MNSLLDPVGVYAAQLHVGGARAYKQDKGLSAFLIALLWLLFPFGLQTLLHPGDMIRLQFKLLGQHAPLHATGQQMGIAVVETIVALALLILIQFVCTTLFYRRAQMNGAAVATPALWPLALVFIGVVGNAAWFVGTGALDFNGCVIGLGSAAVTIIAEMVVNGLGRDFVLGSRASNQHPQMRQQSSW